MDSKRLKSELKRLKFLLIILSIIQLGYLLIVFFNAKLWIELGIGYKLNWLIFALNLIVSGIFIWFNWKKMPIKRKEKTNNTFLILFLGIIGMLLWMPNKREVNKLTKES